MLIHFAHVGVHIRSRQTIKCRKGTSSLALAYSVLKTAIVNKLNWSVCVHGNWFQTTKPELVLETRRVHEFQLEP